MKSYVLHIYPRNNHTIVGVVENVEKDKKIPFTSPKELWDIITGETIGKLTTDQNKKEKCTS